MNWNLLTFYINLKKKHIRLKEMISDSSFNTVTENIYVVCKGAHAPTSLEIHIISIQFYQFLSFF